MAQGAPGLTGKLPGLRLPMPPNTESFEAGMPTPQVQTVVVRLPAAGGSQIGEQEQGRPQARGDGNDGGGL